MLAASLTGIFSIVLFGPFVNRGIEGNLEVFLFLMGLMSATISRVWSAELIREGLTAPINITLAVLGAYGAASGGTLKANLTDLMASDEHVAGMANDTASSAGKTLDVRSTVIFALSEGKVTEAWQYIDNLPAFDAFLA